MIAMDGSHGEGGGQILRTSLALSLITNTPFRINDIRANRAKPGLLRQHLTAVHAAAAIGNAKVEGAELGSASLAFTPGAVKPGEYTFSIGTAGSTMLVLQTILLPLALAGGESVVELEGGTHNSGAPPFEFMEHAYLPLLRRMGAAIELELVRPGFYPAGGGRILVHIGRSFLGKLVLEERGPVRRRLARAVVTNLPLAIADREVRTAAEELGGAEMEAVALSGSAGPGNSISIFVESEHVTDVFTAFGARGVPAEAVARDAARQAKAYLDGGAVVGEHLADQLLLPMALGEGGAFTTTPLSLHSTTNIAVIHRFLQRAIAVENGPAVRVAFP